ncbi:MAG: YkgJ family cysteine cluster protein [Proteobacteria bacterium]|nr:MAG: YkgJ family cysteine cluster protein [Pseudomonadota bacterium]
MDNSMTQTREIDDLSGFQGKALKRAGKLMKRGVISFGPTYTLLHYLIRRVETEGRGAALAVSQASDGILDQMESLIEIPKGPQRAVEAHKRIDQSLAHSRKGPATVHTTPICRKGCSDCCHLMPVISDSEADLIAAFVRSQSVEVNVDRLRLQAEQAGREDFARLLSWEDSACVFLTKDGSCGIYKVRPSNCRKHAMAFSSAFCDPRKQMDAPVVINEGAELVTSALLNLEERLNMTEHPTLAKGIIERLQPN